MACPAPSVSSPLSRELSGSPPSSSSTSFSFSRKDTHTPQSFSHSASSPSAEVDRTPAMKVQLNLQAPISDVSVEFLGLKKIREKTLEKEVASLRASRTVEELLVGVSDTHRRFDELQVFQSSVSKINCGQNPGEVKVVFTLKEKPSSYVLGTYVNSRGDVEIEANAHVPALLGSSQTFSLTGGITPVSSTTQLRLSADLFFPRLPRFLSGSCFASKKMMKGFCSSSDGETSMASSVGDKAARSTDFSLRGGKEEKEETKKIGGGSCCGGHRGDDVKRDTMRFPPFSPLLAQGILRAFCTQTSWTSVSSYILQQTGLKAQLMSQDRKHAIGWEASMRDILPCCDDTRMASSSILHMPLRSLKNSLRYDFYLNRLDERRVKKPQQENEQQGCPPSTASLRGCHEENLSSSTEGEFRARGGGGDCDEEEIVNSLFPRQGYVVNGGAEVAIPGGDTRFVKAELQCFACTPLSSFFASSPLKSFSARKNFDSNRRKGDKEACSVDIQSQAKDGESIATRPDFSCTSSSEASRWVLSGRVGCGLLFPTESEQGGRGWIGGAASEEDEGCSLAGAGGVGANVCDRFRLTGPMGTSTALRGFRSYTTGPSDICYVQDLSTRRWRTSMDYLGGDAYLSSEICLSYDLRFPKDWNASVSSSHSPSPLSSSSSSRPRSSHDGSATAETGAGGRGGESTQGDEKKASSSPFHPRIFLFGNIAALGDLFYPLFSRNLSNRIRRHSYLQGQCPLSYDLPLFFHDFASHFVDFLRNWRGSVGWGIALPVYPGVWMEGILSLPVKKHRRDETQTFQLGLRISSGGRIMGD